MKKIKILISVYNDWESLKKLLQEINEEVEKIKETEFHCLIINDASTIKPPKIDVPKNIKTLKIINMKENRGHARCNAFGIRYLSKDSDFDHLIVMDGDGEDRPVEIIPLVEKALLNEGISVVAKRIKRSEGSFFQMLYQVHKIITLVFTGKNINFGNYSCLTRNDVKILSTKESLWSSFSGSLKKYIGKLNTINSIRGLRYFGPSKMSLFNLAIHSFSIIAVFKYTVFLRSTFMIILLSFLTKTFGLIAITFQVLIISFNLLIFIVSMRENETAFMKSNENILNEYEITS